MTTTLRPLDERGTDVLRTIFRFLAIAACAPYLLLKGAWLSGSRLGIPQDSALLSGNEAALHAINALTVLMDAMVIVLALALTMPWGRRLPAWLVLGPLWIGSGLLAPILLAAPLTAVASTFGEGGSSAQRESEPFLEGWVSTVVYGGFTVQALALGTLFVLYVKDRWGTALRGRLVDLRAATDEQLHRALTWVALPVTAVPLAAHLLWALGARAGLPADLADRMDGGLRLTEAVHAGFALCAVAALVLAVYRPRPRARVATVVVLGWCGGSAMSAWSGWWLLMSGTNALGDVEPFDRCVSGTQLITYASQMTAGLLVLTLSVLFAHRHLAPHDVLRPQRVGPP